MPILAHIVATIFVMQASSAESERHYSAFNARLIIIPIRNRLCPDVTFNPQTNEPIRGVACKLNTVS